jgi:hypothetical protein
MMPRLASNYTVYLDSAAEAPTITIPALLVRIDRIHPYLSEQAIINTDKWYPVEPSRRPMTECDDAMAEVLIKPNILSMSHVITVSHKHSS